MSGDSNGVQTKIKKIQVFDGSIYHLVFTRNDTHRFMVRCWIWTGESEISEVFGVPESSLAQVAVISAYPGTPGEPNTWQLKFKPDPFQLPFLSGCLAIDVLDRCNAESCQSSFQDAVDMVEIIVKAAIVQKIGNLKREAQIKAMKEHNRTLMSPELEAFFEGGIEI